jgi:SAM-dependent methyltransferase
MDERSVADIFDDVYSSTAGSTVVRRLYEAIYGDDFPGLLQPFSLVTWSDLRRIARDLCLGRGASLLDLACGEGGPGLWVAHETGASLTGVDISPVAIEHARERARAMRFGGDATFRAGSFAATGLSSASFDGVMSIDALWLAPDKRAALREVARLLRPGKRFVFTTWDFGPETNEPDQIPDHRPLLPEAGFEVVSYDPTPHWEETFRAIAQAHLDTRDDLAAELGEKAADEMVAHHQRRAALLPHWKRILVVAQKCLDSPPGTLPWQRE